MRVLVLVKATADSEAGVLPSTELLEAMGKFNEELTDAGILVAGEGLRPSAHGKRVAFDGTRRTIVDGPFGATGELVAGFWVWEVADLAAAVEWVKRCPNPMPGPSEIRDSTRGRGVRLRRHHDPGSRRPGRSHPGQAGRPLRDPSGRPSGRVAIPASGEPVRRYGRAEPVRRYGRAEPVRRYGSAETVRRYGRARVGSGTGIRTPVPWLRTTYPNP